jgi:hypothetical protein
MPSIDYDSLLYPPSSICKQAHPHRPPFSPYHPLPRVQFPHSFGDGGSTNGGGTGNRSNLVVFVHSRNEAFERRQVIRETWARDATNVYFVVGRFCKVPPEFRAPDEGGNALCQVLPAELDQDYPSKVKEYLNGTILPQQERLRQEQQLHQDILVMGGIDVYRHLTKKLKTEYTFVDKYLPRTAQWILKIDDDMFMRPRELQRYITDTLQGEMRIDPSTQPALVSLVITDGMAPLEGKWTEVVQYPEGHQYPAFPLGSAGHLVSRPVAEYVSTHQDALFEYQSEDVSIGIWFGAGRFRRIPNPPEGSVAPEVRFVNSDRMKSVNRNEGGQACIDPTLVVVGHEYTDEMLRECQDFWDKQESGL